MAHVPGHVGLGFGLQGRQPIGVGVPGAAPTFQQQQQQAQQAANQVIGQPPQAFTPGVAAVQAPGGAGPFQSIQQAQQQLNQLRTGGGVPPIGVGVPGATPVQVGAPGGGGFQSLQQAAEAANALRPGAGGTQFAPGQVPGQAPPIGVGVPGQAPRFQTPGLQQVDGRTQLTQNQFATTPVAPTLALGAGQVLNAPDQRPILQAGPGGRDFQGGPTPTIIDPVEAAQIRAQQAAPVAAPGLPAPVAPVPSAGGGLLGQAPARTRPQAAFREDGATLRAPAIAARERSGARLQGTRAQTQARRDARTARPAQARRFRR